VSSNDEFLYSHGNKAALMNNLNSRNAPSHSNISRPPLSSTTTPYLVMANMFVMEGTSPEFFEDLKKEVQRQAE
jgi:hypothetical protein